MGLFMEYYWLDYYRSKRQEPLRIYLKKEVQRYLRYEREEGKKRQRISEDKLLNAVSCFVCNVLRSVNREKLEISISLNKNTYARIVNGKRTNKVSYRYTRAMLDMLVNYGYIDLEIGGVDDFTFCHKTLKMIPDTTRNSIITIKQKLLDLLKPYLKYECHWQLDNVLVLRDGKGKDVEFDLDKDKRRMLRELTNLNKMLYNSCISLDDGTQSILQLRRIFNNNFQRGGRFYSSNGVIQCNKGDERLKIKIDDEFVIELDYKAIHPSIAYTKMGITLPEGFDHYHLNNWEDFGSDYKTVRQLVKTSLLIAINCDSRREAALAIGKAIADDSEKDQDEKEFGELDSKCNVYDLLDSLIEKHQPIAEQVIYGGMGPQFQYDDSRIAEYVLNHFHKQAEPCIPVHDSFIVRESLEDELRGVMKEAFREILGDDSNCFIDKKIPELTGVVRETGEIV